MKHTDGLGLPPALLRFAPYNQLDSSRHTPLLPEHASSSRSISPLLIPAVAPNIKPVPRHPARDPIATVLRMPALLHRILAHMMSSSPITLNPQEPIDFTRVDSIKFTITPAKLASPARVNKLWNQVATPLLYRNTRIGSERAASALLATLTSSSPRKLGKHIKSFLVVPPSGQQDPNFESAPLNQLVSALALNAPNLLSLNLADCKAMTDAPIILIAQNCPQLCHLDLNRCDLVTSLALDAFATSAPPLEALHLSRPILHARNPLSDSSIARLIAASPRLRNLRLRSCYNVTDLTISTIAQTCPQIMALDLSWCGQITDRAMLEIAHHCKHLRSIALNGCRLLTDRSLKSLLSQSTNLASLSLAHLPFPTDAVLTEMAPALQNLNILSLNGCVEVTDLSIVAIAQNCRNLQSLSLFATNIGDESMNAIATNCTALSAFSISGCDRVTDTGAVSISNLTNLRSLYLNARHITDATCIAIASRCHSIRALSLNDCARVTDDGILALAASNPRLASLSIDRTRVTFEGMWALTSGGKSIREISAKECEELASERGIKELRRNGRIAVVLSNASSIADLSAARAAAAVAGTTI